MDLSCVFDKYKDPNSVLRGRMYVKIFRDAQLISSPAQTNGLDLIFTKYKSKSAGIHYDDFLKSLVDVRALLNCDKEQFMEKLVALEGPIYKGTEAMPVRFYDDKSLFTGVHVHGGPSVVDVPKKNRSF